MATESPKTKKKYRFGALALALVGCLLMWVAMPPLKLSWLAWLALVPFAWLVLPQQAEFKLYRQVWLATFLWWLATLHFVRLPFWGLWFGWALLSFYLSLYGPLFVAASRMMVHRYRVPAVIAIPVCFAGCEWIRVNFLTGFGLACLSHSQFEVPAVLQIAPLCGATGITFVLAAVAAAVAVATAWIRKEDSKFPALAARVVHAFVAVAILVGVLGFGTWTLAKARKAQSEAEKHEHLTVAVIQPSIDTLLKPMSLEEVEANFADRRNLTIAARNKADVDLVIWPESSFRYEDYLSDSPRMSREDLQTMQKLAWRSAVGCPAPFADAVPMVVGTATRDPARGQAFNSAVLFDEVGEVDARYYKNHLVMFGEYFPIVGMIPGLNTMFRSFSSWDAGDEFSRFQLGEVSICPNICFETTVPRLVRRQLNELEAAGGPIDVIVNVTNDGWFFGTSCLDLHLACNVMRAVEARRPLLVSANTGFSAQIDEMGQLVQVGPRRKEAFLICDVRVPDAVVSVYRGWGGWFGPLCGGMVVLCLVASRFRRINRDDLDLETLEKLTR